MDGGDGDRKCVQGKIEFWKFRFFEKRKERKEHLCLFFGNGGLAANC